MVHYDYKSIEAKWQAYWKSNQTFAAEPVSDKPKYYVLDMFPYPSGAGLHVGHPLGYIATDIVARYRLHKGYNVLHPMGFDAFGLPAEQYAIETGQHPASTTETNIGIFLEQLGRIGLAYDPDSMTMKTCDPGYYKWTQWIFLKIFHSCLAYNAYTEVNWCPALGTVLANDEVVNGVSERGGHPVVRKPMRQWAFRMRAYADRLLDGLNMVDWPQPIKEQQRNWIGRSEGANFAFALEGHEATIEVFTTRPDTIFGATYMVLAPEHPMIETLVTDERRDDVMEYVEWAKNRTEVERQQEKKISGKFTGAYAKHPFIEGKLMPIWTADYVLWGYGTGAIMAVPAGDGRDYAFANHFDLEIPNIFAGVDISEEAYESKTGTLANSDFLNGLTVEEALPKAIQALEEKGIGTGTVNYRLRDPNFSRQRYWGEPFPILYKEDVPYALEESELPLELPKVETYQPSGDGQGPLANITDWVEPAGGGLRETNTMPGYAGSSWYFLRYFDVNNTEAFTDPDKEKYWMNVDLYIGGSEHAVGHLMYARLWTKVLSDLGHISFDEPFQKLVNQGMIQGRSSLVYRVRDTHTFVSKGLIVDREDYLDIDKLRGWRDEFSKAEFITEDGKFLTDWQVEKMSKRYHNVVNPDQICDEYGADTLRLYEMFLGPLEDAKPWSMQGIEGANRFLRKAWNLFFDRDGNLNLSDEEPNKDELRVLHQTIGKVEADIDALSFNTSVAQFMKFLNEIQKLKTNKRAILEPFIVLLSPFAPHFSEEIWQQLGHEGGIARTSWPEYIEAHTKVASVTYPVQINGKVRAKVDVPAEFSKEEVEKEVLGRDEVKALIGDKTLRKVIVVPGRIVNLVL
ncbi:UNVERIFIED_CONTAM: hypothetical protein GTU68_057466 [Idotea baltica]|nr:hypothetical protein [Idotea baltica]